MSKSESDAPQSNTSENDTPETKGFAWPSLEQLTGILTLVAAVVGVGKYFYDRAEAAQDEMSARSIEYIERYTDSSLLGARTALYGFWAGQPQLVEVLRSEEVSARSYAAMLQASVFRTDADSDVHEPLLLLDSFYSQVNYCRSAELCDPAILDSYFCAIAQKDAIAYGPFYERLSDLSGDLSLGKTIAAYASVCDVPASGA